VIKEFRPFVIIFLVIIVTSSIIYFHTNSNNVIYAQRESLPSGAPIPFQEWYEKQTFAQGQLSDSPAGVKITSPTTGHKVPIGELVVSGTSTDNATSDCQVYVDLNDIKPMQNTTAVGAGGQNDYSNWMFKYTNKYHLISEGVNELTAKMACIDNPAKVTKYYSVNVTGVATPPAASYATSIPIINEATENNNQTKVSTSTENNNQTKVPTSTDTVDQTPKQTAQEVQEPKQGPQSESKPQTDLVSKASKETQKEATTKGQKDESSNLEVVPLGELSYDSDTLTEEPEETTDGGNSTELIEPAGQLPNYAYNQEQINRDELHPMETLSHPQKFPEQQPLVENQPLETLSHPQGFSELQPLETLESNQTIEEPTVQSFSQPAQLSSGIQPLEQEPALLEQKAPKSMIHTEERHGKSANEIKQPYDKDGSMPFILPFDSLDVTPRR
jgi:hypothetical protein